jgi:16S rRNA (cytosine1407-C5)-methyltransferase
MRSEIKNLPEVFLERFKKIVPQGKFDQLANTFCEPKPATFRVNTLKTSREVVREKLEAAGNLRVEPVSWYGDAFILREGRLRELQETDVYKNGEIYVQNLSSMIPPIVLEPAPGERILDLTAAPGSKTTQIACLMNGEGEIVANDNDKVRFFKLKATTELQGAQNVKLSLRYGESFGREFPESFDRVLLDAPCSAEGRFNTREPASFGYWKPRKVDEMARKQRKLLFSTLSALRPGGVLVYSTCTFAPEENEAVLNMALKKFGESIEMEAVRLLFTNQMPGLGSWEGEQFHPSVRKSVRILPSSQMEGFFVARIIKRKAFDEKI